MVAEVKLEELEEAYFVVTAESRVDTFDLTAEGGTFKSSTSPDLKVTMSNGTFTRSHGSALSMKVVWTLCYNMPTNVDKIPPEKITVINIILMLF